MSKSKEQIVLNVEDADHLIDGLAMVLASALRRQHKDYRYQGHKPGMESFQDKRWNMIEEVRDMIERIEGMKEHPLTLHFNEDTPLEVGYSCEDGHYNTAD